MSNLERLTKRLEGLKEGHTAYLGSIGNTQRSPGALLSLKMEAKRYEQEREEYPEGSKERNVLNKLLGKIKTMAGGRRKTLRLKKRKRVTRKK